MTDSKPNQYKRMGIVLDDIIKVYGNNRTYYLLDAIRNVTRPGHLDMIKTYILFVVSNYYGVTIEDVIMGGKRSCTEAKKIAMYILHEDEGVSVQRIGEMFNNLSKGRTHGHISDVKSWLENVDNFPDINYKYEEITIQLNRFKVYVKNNYFGRTDK